VCLVLARFKFSLIDYSYDTKDFLKNTENYENKIKDRESGFKFENEKLKGFATPSGTKAYSELNKSEGIIR